MVALALPNLIFYDWTGVLFASIFEQEEWLHAFSNQYNEEY